MHFRNTTNVSVTAVTTNGGDDGVDFTKSSNFSVTGSTLDAHDNSGLGAWDGDSNFTFSGNTIDSAGAPAGTGGGYVGISITGANTLLQPAAVSGVTITNNIIRNVQNAGIWIQGGYNPATGTMGNVNNFYITNNTITITNVSLYHGIAVSEGTNGTISGNTISNTADDGIAFAPEAAGGLESGVTMTNNSISMRILPAARMRVSTLPPAPAR